MDAFRLKRLAGHADISTTMRYIHLNEAGDREAMEKAWEVRTPHKSPHSAERDERRAVQDELVSGAVSTG